ncbi:hypothetical protein OG413_07910 [Streptomyces sp. NBC_01433]|uniref:hypothetical protein n=1 Tax=Streptomyces sp. NBC_01433 TaxID=2903864 RepID=UPI002257C0C5|nr:hypothetical protein [Streptomyces sp. NBC_01433]MCX4675247.1 hypothetical protein [Streptomyces sp. NBC_01433]
MEALDEQSWADAVALFERYSYVAVVRRSHAEWWYDVWSIMRGEGRDPRGWLSLDPAEGEDERMEDPTFPFSPPVNSGLADADAEAWRGRAFELPRSSVRTLLVTLATNWLNVSREWEFDRRRPGMERRADLLLSRFPPGSRFYSNVGWRGADPDFYEQPVREVDPFSQFDWDAGLIAVSEAEVGIFWSFDAR